MRSELKRRIRAVEGARTETRNHNHVSVVVAAMPSDVLIQVDQVHVERMPNEGDDHFRHRAGVVFGADHLILLIPKTGHVHAH